MSLRWRAPGALMVVIVVVLVTLIGSVLTPPPAEPASSPAARLWERMIAPVDAASWPRISAAEEPLAALVLPAAPPPALAHSLDGLHDPAARRRARAERVARQERLLARIEALGGIPLARLDAAGGVAAALTGRQAAALRAMPDVGGFAVIQDYRMAQGAGEGAILSLQQAAALLKADQVWNRGVDGTGADIAVVDSGIDYTHAKLGGSGNPADYRRAACGNAAIAPGDPACDPTLAPPPDLFPNARVRGGYDYLGDRWPNPDPRCGALEVCIFFDPNPIDLAGHGTQVADIAAGGPSAPGATDVGIAPGANLWAFKACNANAGLCNGTALLRAMDAALDLDGSDRNQCVSGACQAYDPADIIVLAISAPYGQPEDALTLFADLATYYGALVVAAGGNDGQRPFVLGAPASAAGALAVAPSALINGVERIASGASRGPRIADSRIKPDLAAPGRIWAARAGSGSGVQPLGGSSAAAAAAAGAAALIKRHLEQLGVSDTPLGGGAAPAHADSLAPYVKIALMNHGQSLPPPGGGGAALPTVQGSGRPDLLAAFRGRTLAWDATEILNALAQSNPVPGCAVEPLTNLLQYLFFRAPPACVSAPLFAAWTAQTGSVSFGYQPASETRSVERQVVVWNYGPRERTYQLQIQQPGSGGVAFSVSPTSVIVPPGGIAQVTVRATITPAALASWNAGVALTEVAGALVVDGGTNNRVRLPLHIVPRPVAQVAVQQQLSNGVTLANSASAMSGLVKAVALVDVSPDQCDTLLSAPPLPPPPACADPAYTVGAQPGLGYSPADLAAVGLRSYSVPGLNASHGLPPAPPGAMPDEMIEFVLTVHDRPFRASPDAPAQFEIHLDSNRDGTVDYIIYNAPGNGTAGANDVFIRAAGTSAPPRRYTWFVADFYTQVYALPVPAAAVGLRSDQPFNFHVQVYTSSFIRPDQRQRWDCAPGGDVCGATVYTMQTGALRWRPATQWLMVPASGAATLGVSADPGGEIGSPSQSGVLLLFCDAPPGQGWAAVSWAN